MTPSTLVEHVADWHLQLQVDRPSRMVRNVALTGAASKNGYRYTEQALQEAAPLYEQRPVFLDHAADKSRPQERSTRDLVGSIVNARYDAGRIRGDIRVLDTDSGRTFLALAESDAPGVGMSHVVLAERAKPDGEVTRIHDVVSVDAVVFPATTTTFRESEESSDFPGHLTTTPHKTEVNAAQELTVVATREAVTNASQESADCSLESQDLGLETRLQQLLIERDELLSTLHQERARQSASQQSQTVARLLSESGLPEFAVTDTFRRQFAAAEDTLRRELLRDRLQLMEAVRRRLPVSRERNFSSSALPADTVFVAAVKRHAS